MGKAKIKRGPPDNMFVDSIKMAAHKTDEGQVVCVLRVGAGKKEIDLLFSPAKLRQALEAMLADLSSIEALS